MSKVNNDKSNISEKFRKANEFISRYKDVFYTSDADVGHAIYVTYKLEVSDNHACAERYRKTPPVLLNDVRKHISLLLETGIFRKLEFLLGIKCSVILMNTNATGFCVDFR